MIFPSRFIRHSFRVQPLHRQNPGLRYADPGLLVYDAPSAREKEQSAGVSRFKRRPLCYGQKTGRGVNTSDLWDM